MTIICLVFSWSIFFAQCTRFFLALLLLLLSFCFEVFFLARVRWKSFVSFYSFHIFYTRTLLCALLKENLLVLLFLIFSLRKWKIINYKRLHFTTKISRLVVCFIVFISLHFRFAFIFGWQLSRTVLGFHLDGCGCALARALVAYTLWSIGVMLLLFLWVCLHVNLWEEGVCMCNPKFHFLLVALLHFHMKTHNFHRKIIFISVLFSFFTTIPTDFMLCSDLVFLFSARLW